MDLKSLIAAHKHPVQIGPWSNEKLRARDFPMSRKRGRAYPLTRKFRWQVTTFTCHGRDYRLLAAYHTDVPEFTGVLALDTGTDSTILARWEFHGSHGGWHIHPYCGEIHAADTGVVKPQGVVRIPSGRDRHRRTKYVVPGFHMNDAVATEIVLGRFGVPHQPDLLAGNAIACL